MNETAKTLGPMVGLGLLVGLIAKTAGASLLVASTAGVGGLMLGAYITKQAARTAT